jgi:hypothetical protein
MLIKAPQQRCCSGVYLERSERDDISVLLHDFWLGSEPGLEVCALSAFAAFLTLGPLPAVGMRQPHRTTRDVGANAVGRAARGSDGRNACRKRAAAKEFGSQSIRGAFSIERVGPPAVACVTGDGADAPCRSPSRIAPRGSPRAAHLGPRSMMVLAAPFLKPIMRRSEASGSRVRNRLWFRAPTATGCIGSAWHPGCDAASIERVCRHHPFEEVKPSQ